jgi:hypothetical protein
MDKQVGQKFLEYLWKVPQLFGLLIASFLSGHLWLWIIFAFYKSTTKGDKYLANNYAKTALGVAWFALILFPLYLYKHGFNSTVDTEIFDLIGFTIILGLFLQGLGFIAIVLINNKK